MLIVVVHNGGNGLFEMLTIQHEQPVETLRPNRSYEALGDPIRLRRPKRRAHDFDLLGLKHIVEARGELLTAVADEKPEGFRPISESPGQLRGLLCDPSRRPRRRAPREMDLASAQFNKKEHIQSLQPDRLDGEEIHGEQAPAMRADELPPGRSAARVDRSDPGRPQPRAN